MDYPLNSDQIESQNQKFDSSDLNTRITEADNVAESKEQPGDLEYVDNQGRPITIRTWEGSNQALLRAYDTSKTEVPEQIDRGQAGYADVHFEHAPDGGTRARLGYVETQPEYRGAGNAGRMLSQIEQISRERGASEIYGTIENEEAQSFWKNQTNHGWEIVPKGAYGEAHYKLS